MKKILVRLAIISAFALGVYGLTQVVEMYDASEKTVETNSIKLARKPLVEAERDDDPDEGHYS